MREVAVTVSLPFYMRLPHGAACELTVSGGHTCRLEVQQPTEPIRHPIVRCEPGGECAWEHAWQHGPWEARLSDLLWRTSVRLTFPDAPVEWLNGVGVDPSKRVLGVGGGPPQLLLVVQATVEKLVRAYSWATGETCNAGLVAPLHLTDVADSVVVEVDGGEPVRQGYIVRFNTTPLPSHDRRAVLGLLGDPAFPVPWQRLLLAAASALARHDIGPALLQADAAAEVFIDGALARAHGCHYELRDDGAHYRGKRLHRTFEKFGGPVRDLVGKSICEADGGLYTDLVHLHKARNVFAHRGELWYRVGPQSRVQVDAGEASRLLARCREAIERTASLLRQRGQAEPGCS